MSKRKPPKKRAPKRKVLTVSARLVKLENRASAEDQRIEATNKALLHPLKRAWE